MRSFSLFALVSLAACDAAATDTAGGDTAEDPYAIPEDYRDQWDVEAVSCPEGALGYWTFDGEISGGTLEGQERWFWFFPDEGDGTDCVDTFDLVAEEKATPVDPDPCYSCDRDFAGTYDLAEKTCNWNGYENLLDNDDTETVDDESYKIALMFDLDRYDGVETDVWSFIRDPEQVSQYNDRETAKGEWSGADKDADGHLRWTNKGTCVTVTTE